MQDLSAKQSFTKNLMFYGKPAISIMSSDKKVPITHWSISRASQK